MAGFLRLSPDAEISSSIADPSLSPVPTDSPIANLTGQLEEMDNNPFACGGYSDVYKYRARNSSFVGLGVGSNVFAVKTASVKLCIGDSRKGLNKLRREIGVWVSLNHKNVLKLHGVLYRDGIPFPSLVSDFMEKGTAEQYLRNDPEANLIHLVCDITKGLSYLHEKGIAHGDIKGDNVLVAHDGCGRIGDFGLSRMLGHDGFATELSTTDGNRSSRWTAIEYLNFKDGALPPQGPTKAGDIWSVGCTVLQLFSGELPFYDAKQPEVVIRLSREELPKFPPSSLRPDFEMFRKGITAFCHLCWVKDPVHRPAIYTLESVICSYCSEATCNYPGELNEAPQGSGSTTLEEDLEDPNQINENGIDASDGSRSRSSSQSTITPDSSVNQPPDLQEPLVSEPEEESNSTISPEASRSENTETDEINSNLSNPFSSIPPPPPPSIESILHYKYISAQAVLNELCQVRSGFKMSYVDGESTGPSHSRTHVVICIVNDKEYGIGSVEGKKKHAKEKAALVALERLYLEYPAYISALSYLPILTSHLSRNNLSARATWNIQSGPSADNPERWVYRKTFTFDGIPVAAGVGSSSAIAEEAAARNVALAWHRAAANET